jgi:predicted ATPase/DNA-binding winged helix-turn-helix (wHTH) protein
MIMAKTDPDSAAGRAYRFGAFLLRPARRELLADGVPVTLGSRAFDLLAALVEHAGQVVSRDALTAVAWPRMVVEDSSLRVQIAHLRRVLGPEGPGIVTVPGQGYRFDGVVQVVDEGAAPAAQVIPAARVLPRRLTAIIGRDAEVARVQAAVQPGRVVTLVGIGGIGKTTVALAATERLAGDYADGICFLDLGTLPDPVQGLAAAFGAARMDALGHAMAGHRLLVVLDGCDYAPEAVAALLAQLAQAPGVAVLATSRHPLGAAAEHRLRLPPLDLPPEGEIEIDAPRALTFGAVQLFASRAQASGAGYTLTDRDAPVVAALCRRLDGLPLAIELAAGCVDAFGVLGLLDQADDRFNLLEARRRSPQERQRSLRASLDWSYTRLSAPAQTALQRLSVLDGTFTLASATAAIGADGIDNAAAADLLEALVAQSLVSPEATDDGPRFRLSAMVRAYARERLRAVTSPR